MNNEKLISEIVEDQKQNTPRPAVKNDIVYYDYDNDLGQCNPKYNDPIKQREQ